MPAKRIYQVKLLTKAGGQRGYGVNVRDIYLFLVSNFKSEGPHQKLPLLPGTFPEPGLHLALPPRPSLAPSPSPEL